jgi:AcrR family transcriptional regulator
MARLPTHRGTPLSAAEIAAEALRQFDEGPSDPTIRALAAALRVAPSAIYHHFDSSGSIYQAAVGLVWSEAMAGTVQIEPQPLTAPPLDVLVAVGVATRRAWLAHHRLASRLAATPQTSAFTDTALRLMGDVFARMGLDEPQAARALHSYASFMIGAVLFAADRKTANERLRPGDASHRTGAAPVTVDNVMSLSDVDPVQDEAMYTDGLRRLIRSLTM